jgi:predicted RNase H-like HicB family nuclease
MTTVVFVAAVTGDRPLGYKATFPDLEGVNVEARDLPELMVKAREAATARLEAIAQSGEAWPQATPLEEVVLSLGETPVPIDISVDDPPVRINVSLGERLVQRLDAAAEARGMTRSGFIAQSVRASLGESQGAGTDFEALGKQLQDELTALGRRINESIGPESPFTRRMNELDERVYETVRKAADSVSAALSRRRGPIKPKRDTEPDGTAAS